LTRSHFRLASPLPQPGQHTKTGHERAIPVMLLECMFPFCLKTPFILDGFLAVIQMSSRAASRATFPFGLVRARAVASTSSNFLSVYASEVHYATIVVGATVFHVLSSLVTLLTPMSSQPFHRLAHHILSPLSPLVLHLQDL
jgi:hypothetical protein